MISDSLADWVESRLYEITTRIEQDEVLFDELEAEAITAEVDRFGNWWHHRHPHPRPNPATSLTMKLIGAKQMAVFTINTTDGEANLQFDNSAGSAVAGPNDDVTGDPVVPEVVSDTPGVLTVAASVAGADPGVWTAALTPVAPGTANVSVSPLTNSDGSPVNETEGPNEGQPFALPAAIEVTVTADDTPTGLSLSVTG